METEEKELTALEKEFEALQKTIGAEISAKLKVASEALREAEKLSNEHGIPFRSNVSRLSQSYCPASYLDKFEDLDEDFVDELTGVFNLNGYGWQHSAVCW